MLQYLILGFFLGALVMFVSIGLMYYCKEKKPHNNVHFYVTRDKNQNLMLWLGKPQRDIYFWDNNTNSRILEIGVLISNFGLNTEDFKNLKWEDEPVEVFLNLED